MPIRVRCVGDRGMEGSGDERPVYGGDGVGLIIGLREDEIQTTHEKHGHEH